MTIHRLSCSQLFTHNYPNMFRSPLGSFSRVSEENHSLQYVRGVLLSPQPEHEGNKLQRQKILVFLYPIYNHNWRKISTIYVYITRLASSEIFSSSNKIYREVGRAKELSAPRYNNSYISIPVLQTFKHLRLFGYNFSLSLNTSRQLNFKSMNDMSGKEALSVLRTAPTFRFCLLSPTFPVVERSLYSTIDLHWLNIVVRYYTGLGGNGERVIKTSTQFRATIIGWTLSQFDGIFLPYLGNEYIQWNSYFLHIASLLNLAVDRARRVSPQHVTCTQYCAIGHCSGIQK